MLNIFYTKAEAYTPLVTDLEDFSKTILTGSKKVIPTTLEGLINFSFYALLAVAVVLAIFGVIRGGYVYLTSGDNANNKGRAKRILQASVGGLLLALGGWLILKTINPEILKFNPQYKRLDNAPVTQQSALQQSPRDPAREVVNKLEMSGITNGQDMYSKLRNGSDYLGYELQDLGEKEWAEIIAKSDKEEVRQFLLRILENQILGEGGSTINERRLIDAMGYISKSNPDLVNEANALFESRKSIGFYYTNANGGIQLRSVASAPTESNIINNIGSYSNIFNFNDTQGISALYNAGGGKVENNSFSSSLVSVLNNQSNNEVKNISTWVDKNGTSIGIEKVGETYQLSN
jgi:hypothetical protein